VNGPIELTTLDLVFAASLILLNATLSFALGLGLGRKLLIAATRTVVQLTALGWVLIPVFNLRSPWPIAAMALAMIFLAARAAIGRSSRTYRGATRVGFTALLTSCGLTAVVGCVGIVGVEPWWEPRYTIPLLGMMLGNGLTGISLGLDRALAELDAGRARVEGRLALGASTWEAARPVAREAVRAGMIPILNSMTVVGLVSIPGMMTGQLLGGTEPGLAARYQIVIMFMIACATAGGTAISVLLTLRGMFDADGRLRVDRIRRRDESRSARSRRPGGASDRPPGRGRGA